MAEYIVTVKKGVNWEELHSELKNDTSADSSVDSSIIPDREVPVVNERPNNPRNTHYDLTDDEAEALQKTSPQKWDLRSTACSKRGVSCGITGANRSGSICLRP